MFSMPTISFFREYEEELRQEHGPPNNAIFTVSGFTGAGTSTVVDILQDAYDLSHIYAGQFFRDKATEYGMTIEEFEEATTQIEAEEDVDFDVMWDKQALEYAYTRDRFILEGRMAGALLQDIAPVRIFVKADPDVVAERIMEREGFDTVERARDYLETRIDDVLQRYKEKYSIDPREERFHNIIIDNSGSMDALRSTVLERVREELPEELQKAL